MSDIIKQDKFQHIDWTDEMLAEINNKYEYVGESDVDTVIQNLEKIINRVPSNTKWIFILGSE